MEYVMSKTMFKSLLKELKTPKNVIKYVNEVFGIKGYIKHIKTN